MANKLIPELPQAGPITGLELVPVQQGGVTVQATVNQIVATPSQFQTFLTVSNEPTLPASRYLTVGTGLGLTDTGPQGTYQITLNATAGSLESSGLGLIAKTASGTVAPRTISITGAGLSITNGNGVSGNPTLTTTGFLYSLANFSATGIVASTGSTLTPVTIGAGLNYTGTTLSSTTNGTVTSVSATAGTGISVTGSPITSSGTLNITNTAPDQTVVLTAGTGISTSGTYPSFTVTNSAPDRTVAIASGTGISATGTYPNFTVANTAPDQTVAISSGTGISVTGTYPNFTVTNTAPSSGGTVTSVSGTTGRITSTGGTTPVIDLASGIATAGTTGSSTLIPVVTIDTYGRVTGITTASNPQGTVTSVTGTAPVVSSGGNTPAISMAKATTSVDGYLSATDWTTFNNKSNTTGTVTSVAATVPSFLSVSGSPITSTGTLALTYSGTALPVANGGTGLTSLTANYIPYGNGTSAFQSSSNLQFLSGNLLLNQTLNQGTGILQTTGLSNFNGTVTATTLNMQGGNNLILQSQALNTAPWGAQGGGVITMVNNAAVAPDGTTTATSLIPTVTSSNAHRVNYGTTSGFFTAGQSYTLSGYFKANGYTAVRFTNDSPAVTVVVDLVGLTASGGGLITSVGNGWYRVICPSFVAGAAVNIRIAAYDNAANATSQTAYTGDGTSSIYAWGIQFEAGTTASVYTPTTTAQVLTANNINVTSGQIFANATGTASTPAYSFGGTPTTGLYAPNSSTLAYSYAAYPQFYLIGSGNGSFQVAGSISIGWSPTNASVNPDTTLWRDAANTVAQRNSTNAQTFRLYNTYTSTSLGEWLSVDWTTTSNTATIATKANGAGVVRTLATGNPLVISPGYTVATLPTGVVGMRAYVTNALAPAYGVAVAGGGAVTIPVFYNGANWICA